MLRIGITGGIGCGKSQVCRQLEQAGIPIIHADLVARELINTNENIKRQMIERFGDDVYLENGELDRKKVGSIVFNDDEARNTINRIVHPHVIKFQENELTILEQSGKVKVAGVEAALIFESDSHVQFDKIIVVAASQEVVIQRLMKRDGLTTEEIMKRINSQMPLSEKIKRADYIVTNNGPLDELNHEVKRLLFWINNQER